MTREDSVHLAKVNHLSRTFAEVAGILEGEKLYTDDALLIINAAIGLIANVLLAAEKDSREDILRQIPDAIGNTLKERLDLLGRD
jgi:hypothetical protein